MALLRLDKYLADMQVGTRSQVKEYIRKKRIKVNGVIVSTPDCKINPDEANVVFDGNPVNYVSMEYYMLNKPQGVLSATMDKNASTVIDLITTRNRKDLFPVGRLDKDTEGLLLITNDGQLAHDMLSPKKHVDKQYYAIVAGIINDSAIESFEKGLSVDEEFTAMPAQLNILKKDTDIHAFDVDGNEYQGQTEVLITIHEGKFHQIKRMFEAIDSKVLFLKRLSMGTLILDKSLAPGEYRKLTQAEIDSLYNN